VRRVLLALALAGAIGGCGGGDGGGSKPGGELVWDKKPSLIVPKTLPNDRIVTGVVRNDSLRRVQVDAKELRLVDDRGGRVPGSIVFLNGYLHGLFPPTREPQLSEQELERIGRRARFTPGKTLPLTVSWRERKGQRSPVRIDWGAGTLPLP
jgi:hypothetical protein